MSSVLDNLYHYKFRVDRCIDGDTIEGKLDKGRKSYDEDVRIRMLGINAPEISKAKTLVEKEKGLDAKAFLESIILGKEVVVKTYKDKDDDSFGRMLGEIYLCEPGKPDMNINDLMIISGHAVRYNK